jgi:tetratricopeptide (TPR) repeat protein
VTFGKKCFQLGLAGLLVVLTASAQTLQQAESLWKARRFKEANDVFKALVGQNPKNPDYKVRWGRLFLDRAQPEDAQAEFEEALALKKDHAGAMLGLALVAAESFERRAGELARKALEIDPRLVEAQELLARLALEDNNNAKATEEAQKALAIDPNSIGGKAILATIDWLADKKETQWDPKTAVGYAMSARFMTLNRRYDEAVELYRKALQIDPNLDHARSELGIDLMRLGQDQEAYQQLKACWDNGFQDKATKNSLVLMDSYKNFLTYKTDNTIVKVHKKEADLLRPYFENEIKRSIASYEKKYKLKLERPVQVEVYPDHEDFAVRTLGMPGLGALGVTFGYAIAMDSPSGRPPGQFHWASTLWHEMSHVFTLTKTHHRVPRWFTEGLAVHEETAVSPEWGDRLGPDEIAAIKDKKLLPITELDRGFIHPSAPAQVTISYFQAGRICDYINAKWGWDTLLAMLDDFSKNEDTATVVRKNLKMEPADFDKEFLAKLEADTKPVVDHFDEWKKGLKQLAEAVKTKDWGAVIKEGTAIRDFYPEYVEDHSVYEMLAQAYTAKENKPAAMAELQKYVKAGGRNPATIKQLAKLLSDSGNKKEAAATLERLNYIYLMDMDQHQDLGTLWFEQGNAKGAVQEFHAVASYKPIDPARAHYDLARAYHLNRQDEQAKDELLSALEAAPGYRQAQKLLLELSSESGAQPNTPKKQ